MYVSSCSSIIIQFVPSFVCEEEEQRDEDDDDDEKVQVLRTQTRDVKCAATTDKFRPADRSYRSIRSRDCIIPMLIMRYVTRAPSPLPIPSDAVASETEIFGCVCVSALDRFSNKAISKIRDNDAAAFILLSLPLPLLSHASATLPARSRKYSHWTAAGLLFVRNGAC